MKNQITLLVLAAILSVAIAQKDLTVSCTSCGTSTCASGYCFNIKGSSFNETYLRAPGQAVQSWTFSKLVSQQLLHRLRKHPLCSRNLHVRSQCSICFPGLHLRQHLHLNNNLRVMQFGCRLRCQVLPGCDQIAKHNSRNRLRWNLPHPSTSTRSVQGCSGGYDGVGGQNDCCMTFQANSAPVCITQNSFLASSTLVQNYVKGTNFEIHFGSIVVTLLALCLAFMLWF